MLQSFLPQTAPGVAGVVSRGDLLFPRNHISRIAQEDYTTPQEAVEALVDAARIDDEKALLVVFGRGGEDIVSSGDKVADDAIRESFSPPMMPSIEINMDGNSKATMIVDRRLSIPDPACPRKGKW